MSKQPDKDMYGNRVNAVLYELIDSYTSNPIDRIKCRQLIDKALRTAQLQLVDELMEQLPDKRVGTEKMPLNDIERGYNVCVEDAISVLQQYKANLEERG